MYAVQILSSRIVWVVLIPRMLMLLSSEVMLESPSFPFFSQVPGLNVSGEELDALTVRTQFGGDEVVQAKAGAGSATLSMAYAGYIFTENVLRALRGGEGIVQCAYVESDLTDAQYFASPCKFGKNGVEEVMGFGELSPYEQQWFEKMLPDLKKQIQKGKDFVNN
mmetsp:Transcript_2464/g.3290  ORF Transcript_2464/g.3290 Transcript_2464/m.3290 type:complete len:165 (-) Transcript_2464:916-1410(-)